MGISIWDDERVVTAFQKYCDQKIFSYKEIAQRLSTDFGIPFTRNMCIGRGGRMGIVSEHRFLHTAVQANKIRAAKVRVRKPRMVKTGFANFAMRKQENAEYKIRTVEIVCETSFEDVVGCRYPTGDLPFFFCDGPQQEGSSYCKAHHALCCEKPKPRREQYLVRAATA